MLGGDAADAYGGLGIADEGHDDAAVLDALHLALDAGKGSLRDEHLAVLLADEVGVYQGHALAQGVGTCGVVDEMGHLQVGNPEDLCLSGFLEGALGPELHGCTLRVIVLEQAKLCFPGMDEDEVADGVLERGVGLAAPLDMGLYVQVGLVASLMELVAHLTGFLLLTIAEPHGIPAQLVVVFFLKEATVHNVIEVEWNVKLRTQ